MKYTYTNHSDNNGLPKGVIFEYEATDILIADKAFTEKFKLKFSDKMAAYITTRIEK